MYLINPELHSRRAFLRRSAQLAFTGVALPTALNLASMGEAAAYSAADGSYKALVCVFMHGGNDYGNTLIPYDDASYNKYTTTTNGAVLVVAGIVIRNKRVAVVVAAVHKHAHQSFV